MFGPEWAGQAEVGEHRHWACLCDKRQLSLTNKTSALDFSVRERKRVSNCHETHFKREMYQKTRKFTINLGISIATTLSWRHLKRQLWLSVLTNPSWKRCFSKALFKAEEFKNKGFFCFRVDWKHQFWKWGFSKNDHVRIIFWFPCPSFLRTQI